MLSPRSPTHHPHPSGSTHLHVGGGRINGQRLHLLLADQAGSSGHAAAQEGGGSGGGWAAASDSRTRLQTRSSRPLGSLHRRLPLLAGLMARPRGQQVLLELAAVVGQRAQQRRPRSIQPVPLRSDRVQPAHCGGGRPAGGVGGVASGSMPQCCSGRTVPRQPGPHSGSRRAGDRRRQGPSGAAHSRAGRGAAPRAAAAARRASGVRGCTGRRRAGGRHPPGGVAKTGAQNVGAGWVTERRSAQLPIHSARLEQSLCAQPAVPACSAEC